MLSSRNQFAGTVTSTAPLFMPPAAVSVKVNVSVTPPPPAVTVVGEIPIVAEPSAAFITFTDGELARAVRLPPEMKRAAKHCVVIGMLDGYLHRPAGG